MLKRDLSFIMGAVATQLVLSQKNETPVTFDFQHSKKAAVILRAVNNKLRQRIMIMLASYGEMTVTDICVGLALEQSLCSQHMGILRRAGIVSTTRVGKYIVYSINQSRLIELYNQILGIIV